MSIAVNKQFSEWLFSKMQEKRWSQADLARASGLTRQAISHYLGDRSRSPDKDALQHIARALKVPIETVYRAAGVLPQEAQDDPWVDEMAHKLSLLPPGMRDIAGRLIDSMLEGEEKGKAQSRKGRPSPAPKG
jgi:transcriptional regulator with XRE-family HTH domain